MDVFISWSGEHSRQVASALADWLPTVLQRVKPWVSDKDIHSGARWQNEVVERLDACSFGIVIVTAENQTNPWLHFEAGALSKSVTDARVVPLLVDLKKSDLLLPLNMFQAEYLDEEGILSLLTALNAGTEDPLPTTTILKLRDTWWPTFSDEVEALKTQQAASASGRPARPPMRSDRELLEEIVTTVRHLRDATEDDVTGPRIQRARSGEASQNARNEISTFLSQRVPDSIVVFTSARMAHVRLPANTPSAVVNDLRAMAKFLGIRMDIMYDESDPASQQRRDKEARRARREDGGRDPLL